MTSALLVRGAGGRVSVTPESAGWTYVGFVTHRLAAGAPPNLHIAIDPRTPGDQGPTFTGLKRVPPGETFSAEPDGTAPKVAQEAGQ